MFLRFLRRSNCSSEGLAFHRSGHYDDDPFLWRSSRTVWANVSPSVTNHGYFQGSPELRADREALLALHFTLLWGNYAKSIIKAPPLSQSRMFCNTLLAAVATNGGSGEWSAVKPTGAFESALLSPSIFPHLFPILLLSP